MRSIWHFVVVLSLTFFLSIGQAAARPDAPPPFVPREPRIALVIGNAEYADAMKLANPANDATLIGATLKKLGFEVILVTDARQKPMQRAIVDFGDRLAAAGPNAVGLFYYAGHGVQLDGQNYLVPTDADIAREVDAEIDGVSADLVLKQMAYAGSRVNIVILDACRNNPLTPDFRSTAAAAVEGFAEIRTKPKGTFIAYSTAPGEVAVDGNDGHSPFAKALAGAMQRPGLDLPEVFQQVRQDVLAATDERQTPWDSSSLVKAFYFAPVANDLVAAATPEPAVEPLTPIAGLVAAEAEPEDEPQPVFVALTRSLFAKSGSRLRAEPSTDASVVAKLTANAEIRAVGRSQDGAWYEVATRQGKTAYIHADAVSDFRPAGKPKPAAMPVKPAAFAPQPVASAPRPKAQTGIGMVDQALKWLQSGSGVTQPPQNPVRASR